MKSIICVLSLLFMVPQAEAHFRSFHNKKSKHYSYHKHSHKHGRYCGHKPPAPTPPGPVCNEDERVINGDFEDNAVTNSSQWQLVSSLTGWDIDWTKGGCCKNSPLAELQAFPNEQLDGSTQYIELDTHYQSSNHCSSKTNIQITQEIEAKVGEILKLEFNYKPRSLTNGKMELVVEFGDNDLVFGNFTNTNWKSFSRDYKVTSKDLKNGKMKLSIKDTGLANTYGMFVDNVSVKATNCNPTPKNCTSASSVVSFSPIGASAILAARLNPLKALGLPDGEPVVEANVKFTALGFGGSIVLKLDAPVKNVVGPDLRIWETTAGNQTNDQYTEEADVYVSANGLVWVYAGRVVNDNNNEFAGLVDIGPLEEALYVKIVDQSPVIAGRDGFDLDAVTCVNQDNEFNSQFYYIDNTTKKIYTGAVEGSNVFLKEYMNSPYTTAHMAQPDFETLVVVEASGDKRIKEFDIETKISSDAGRFNFLGSLAQVYASEDYIIANQEGTNKIYSQDIESNTTTLLGTVMYNQKPLILKGGDFYQGLTNVLYVVTNQDGGSLYALENDPSNDTILNATLIVRGLGTVTGLVKLPSGEMLVSLMNSTSMKVVDLYAKTVRSVNLKGDLKKQGSKGGDLAGFDTL